MKLKRLFHIYSSRILLLILNCFIFANLSADNYTAELTVESGDPHKGLVLSSVKSGEALDKVSFIDTSTCSRTSTQSKMSIFAYVRPSRGFIFSGWEYSGDIQTSPTENSYRGNVYYTTQLTCDPITKAAKGQITANWEEDPDSYTITYKKPENGFYTVSYSYLDVNSSGTAFIDGSFQKNVTTKDESITTYKSDKVILSTTLDSFIGWYDGNGKELSNEKSCVLTISENTTITAKFDTPSANQACVISNGATTPYSTLSQAIAAANGLTTNPTVKLLDNVVGLTSGFIISKPMTLDLNGKTLHGTCTNILTINSNSTVSIEGSGNITSTPNLSTCSGIYVLAGTLYINSGNINIHNEAENAKYTYAINVGTYGTAYIQGGNINVNTTQNAYAISSSGKVNIAAGSLYSKALNGSGAYGIYMTGNSVLNMTGGNINTEATESSSYGLVIKSSNATTTISGGAIKAIAPINYAYGIDNSGTLTINDCSISAKAQSQAYSIYARSGNTIINGGQYSASANSSCSNIYLLNATDDVVINGGYFTTKDNMQSLVASEKNIYDLVNGGNEEALYTQGYRYYVADKNLEGIYVATTAGEYFTDLHEAISTAEEYGGDWVVLVNNVILDDELIIPSGVHLAIPYSNDYEFYSDGCMDQPEDEEKYTFPTPFKTLKLTNDANIIVNEGASLNVAGQQYSIMNSTNGLGIGCVSGTYGCIDMSEGGSITLKNGSELNVYGYIVGQDINHGNNSRYSDYNGHIIAQAGVKVREGFVINDWRGGGRSACIGSDQNIYMVSPFQQYCIPNIEVPLTLEKGAHEQVIFNVHGGGASTILNFPLFGTSDAMFNIGSGSVTKWYDPTTDYMRIDVNGDFAIDKIAMTTNLDGTSGSDDELALNSSRFVLPITSNMDIVINRGNFTIPSTTETALLPGAKITLGKDATANIVGKLYLYDVDEWGKYSWNKYYYKTYNRPTAHASRGNGEDISYLSDAEFIVDGKMEVSGSLITTAGGANLSSTNEGQITFANSYTQPANAALYQLDGTAEDKTDFGPMTYEYQGEPYKQYATPRSITSAQLLNADGTHASTTNASAGDTYSYRGGKWMCNYTEYPLIIKAENHWSTCILPFSTDIPDGLKVYTCSDNDDEYLYIEEVDKLESYTPYIIYSQNGINCTLTGEYDNENNPEEGYVDSGFLHGAVTPQTVTTGYVLQNKGKGDGAMFYIIGAGKSFTIPSGKCWVTIPEDSPAKEFAFKIKDIDATIVSTTHFVPTSEDIYTLQGTKIEKMIPGGIYIKGNKKIIYRQ